MFLSFFKINRYLQEMLLVIIIIGILAILAVQSYIPGRVKAHVISITGTFDVIKRDSHIYYAFHGKWPKNIDQALETGMLKNYSDLAGQYKTDIKYGAVTFTFRQTVEGIPGKRITLRPVVQSDDPFGPVHWICGSKNDAIGWTISGVDETTIEDKYIPKALR